MASAKINPEMVLFSGLSLELLLGEQQFQTRSFHLTSALQALILSLSFSSGSGPEAESPEGQTPRGVSLR